MLIVALSTLSPAQVVPGLEASPMTVPPNQEFNRSFESDRISIQMVSRPYFGLTPAEWSTVEIGPASLTFLKEKGGGAIVLLGDQALPFTLDVGIGPDNRSVAPVEFGLSYDRTAAMATLAIGGREFSLPAQPPAGPLQVVISAGSVAPWQIDSIQILGASQDADLSPGTPNATGNANQAGKAADQKTASAGVGEIGALDRNSAISQALALFSSGKTANAERALENASRRKKGSAAWHLDVAAGFVKVALLFAEQGNVPNADAAAQLALVRLQQVANSAAPGEDDLAANALSLAGMVQERFLGNWTAAKESYGLAEQKWPQGAWAKQAAKRLDEQDQELARKGRGPGG